MGALACYGWGLERLDFALGQFCSGFAEQRFQMSKLQRAVADQGQAGATQEQECVQVGKIPECLIFDSSGDEEIDGCKKSATNHAPRN